MGIKSLNPFLKKQAPSAFFNIPIESFSGKRVAVDANNFIYASMATARKRIIKKTDISLHKPDPIEIRREWFLALVNFITGWMSNGVSLLFVFDGPHPVEKEETKAKRKETRVSAKAKIDELYKQLENIDLEFPGDIVEKLRKELCNYNCIASEDFDLFKTVSKGIGIPCLQAEGDGERLCSSLCIEGKVAAVFSSDTDNLVYGCPLVITGYSETCSYDEYGYKVSHVDCVRLDKILEIMKMSHKVFVDLCIMSGCDYNNNIPGYGTVKSLGLLKKFETIDNLSDKMDISCLKHERCRELFEFTPSEKLTKDPLSLNLDKSCLVTMRDYLEMVGVAGQISRLVSVYSNAPEPTDGYLEMLSLKNISDFTPPKIIREIQTKFLKLNVIA